MKKTEKNYEEKIKKTTVENQERKIEKLKRNGKSNKNNWVEIKKKRRQQKNRELDQ